MQSSQKIQTDQKGGYLIFNTIFLVFQTGLLAVAVFLDMIQGRYEMTIFSFLLNDVLIGQMFFPECFCIFLGALSNKTKYKNAVVQLGSIGLVFSLILMGWMGFIGFMGGIEGAAYPAPIPAAVVSIVFLVVKVIVDVENALTKGRKRRRKKSREK